MLSLDPTDTIAAVSSPPGAGFRGASGGIFADMGVHEFDQVRWLTGQEFCTLRVAVRTRSPGAMSAEDPSAFHPTAPMRHVGDAGIMRDEDDCRPRPVNLPKDVQDDVRGVFIEIAGGFVGEEHCGRRHEGAGEGGPLLLAA